MEKSKTATPLFATFLAALCILAPACSPPTKQEDSRVRRNPLPPTTLLSSLPADAQPKVVWLDTVPPPVVVTAANSNGSFFTLDSTGKTLVDEAKGKGFFTTYTTDDGLSLDQVNCSFKDKWGYLWFGTNGGGVSRYDGKNFTTYTTAHGLANNVVWCIAQDGKGNIWFGTDGSGASKYNGETFTTYTTVQGLADDVVFSIVEDKRNRIWFGTLKGGVSRYDGKNFTTYSVNDGLSHNAVRSIFQDSKGNFWLATLGGGVSLWDGKSFSNYTTKEGLAGNKVWSVAEDDSGNVWFGSDGDGLTRFDGKTFAVFPVTNGKPADAVQSIHNDKQGSLWLGTQTGGLIKHDGKKFTRYSTANGLASNQIKTITGDQNGNLWIGSFGGGVCKYAGSSFTNFTTAQGLAANVVFSMAEDDSGNLWLGTSGGGASKYNGSGFVNFTQADGLARNEIYCVFKARSGDLWFGTSGGGVSRYNGKRFTTYTTTQGLANNIVFSILEDATGNLWFSTSGGGVSRFDGSRFTNYTTKQGLAGDVVFCSRQDKKGNLWFGTLGGGVSKFDGKGFTRYSVDQGLSDNVVWSIAQDKSENLWFGTQHGLSLLTNPTNQQASSADAAASFTTFSTSDGLPNDFVTQVIPGDGENMYAGTNLGLCELLPNKTSSAKNWVVGKIFNTRHGYPVKDVNAGLQAMYTDSKGVLWIGTGSDKTGLVRFETTQFKRSNQAAPAAFINQLKLNNEALNWQSLQAAAAGNEATDSAGPGATVVGEIMTYGRVLSSREKDSLRQKFDGVRFDGISKWQPLPQNLVLPYYFNNVGFAFGAVETGKNFLVSYSYFLDGYDKEWSPPGPQTFVNFGNISEGRYTFYLKVKSPDGVWGQPVQYSFTVLPPWWRTWWMFGVYALFTVAVVLLFIRWKHKQIIHKQKILEHKVATATKQVREEADKVQAQRRKAEETLEELKETQAQLIQSEKMASLGELTAGIAHEIQNPLNFVNNFSEVSSELVAEMTDELNRGEIEEAKFIAADLNKNLQKINHHGKRADAIVKAMLQHSRTGTGKKEPTDINALADEYLRLSYHGLRAKNKSFNAGFTTSFDESIGKVEVLPQELGRVLLNLYNNAFYSVSKKQLQSPAGYQPVVELHTKKEGDQISILIRDNGLGMPKKIRDKIYQPFFTTKPTGEGTGLGLSMSYDIIVKGHGGELAVESEEGQFAAFKIILPARSNALHSN